MGIKKCWFVLEQENLRKDQMLAKIKQETGKACIQTDNTTREREREGEREGEREMESKEERSGENKRNKKKSLLMIERHQRSEEMYGAGP